MSLYESIKNNLDETDDKYMEEWRSICEAFCKKIGAELLFVNTDNFGYMDKDGNTVHMYADELEQFIKNGGLKESEGSGLDDSIKSWYLAEFPEDDYGEHLKDDVTFKQVYDALGNVEDIYSVIFNGDSGDSIVRERIFNELSDRMNVDYDVIYYKWLYGREDGKSPNEGNHSSVKDAKEIIQSIMGESEDELDYRSSYKEIYGDTPDYTELRQLVSKLSAIMEQASEDGVDKYYCDKFKNAIGMLADVSLALEDFYENKD